MSRSGPIVKRGFNKVKAGGDQAFTLPYGTSAAPIMNVKAKPYIKKVKNVKVGDKVYKGTGNKKIKITMYPPLKGPAGSSQVTKGGSGGKKPSLSKYEGGRMTGFNIKRFMK